MKLPLKYFLAFSILLGAVGVPWAWRVIQERQEAEVRRLGEHLQKLYSEQPVITHGFFLPGTPSPDPRAHWKAWEKKVEPVEKRFEELTGNKPNRPPVQQIDVF